MEKNQFYHHNKDKQDQAAAVWPLTNKENE